MRCSNVTTIIGNKLKLDQIEDKINSSDTLGLILYFDTPDIKSLNKRLKEESSPVSLSIRLVRKTQKTLILYFDSAQSPPHNVFRDLENTEMSVESYSLCPERNSVGAYIRGDEYLMKISNLSQKFFQKNRIGKKLDEHFDILDNTILVYKPKQERKS